MRDLGVYLANKASDLKRFVKNRRGVSAGVAALVTVAVLVLILRGNNGAEEILLVTRGAFVQEVSVSGRVVAAQDVELVFPETGRVETVNVKVGDKVEAGQELASLAMGTLRSDLASANANLALRLAEKYNSAVNLETVTEKQDTLVENAYRNLLSEDLEAVPNASYGVSDPLITGRYRGPEGTYKIRIAMQADPEKYDLHTFDIERTALTLLDDEPTPLGNYGLFISFPDDLSSYNETTWFITIPNTKSSSYLTNRNAYEEALRSREGAIANAEADLNNADGASVSDARIAQAQAEVSRIRAAIAERILKAPFAGTITAVEAKVGGIASANAPSISLISADTLEIESFVPEINLSFVKVGAEAVITLDAYGDEVSFRAAVVSVDPAETIRDGVSTYRAILRFLEPDERIRSGMTASAVITADRRSGVISVPQGIVITRDGEKFVPVREDGKVVERPVVTGAVSSFGEIEIVSGLEPGNAVVLSE